MAMTFDQNQIDISGTWTNYSPVTVCFWFKINTLNTNNRLLGSDNLYELRITGSKLQNELFQTDPPPTSTTTIVAGTWYHAVGTATSGGNAEVFINGISEDVAACTGSPSGTTMSLGNRNGAATTDSADGVLDDIRVYNRILSDDEIKTIYASRGTDGIVYGLKHRWLLNEASTGTTASGSDSVKDIAEGSQNGTPVSSPVYAGSRLKFRRR